MTSCSNKEVKPTLPKKKVHNFFFRKPLFWPIFFKNTNFAPPPENCAQKISQNPYFYRLKKRWPSYWPKGGQVIDPTLAKKWPSYWPYNIYIYLSLSLSLSLPFSHRMSVCVCVCVSLSLSLCLSVCLSLSLSLSLCLLLSLKMYSKMCLADLLSANFWVTPRISPACARNSSTWTLANYPPL